MSAEPRSELFTGWGYIPEKVKKAQKKIEMYKFDTDAWSILLREAQSQPVDKARPLYELLIASFSNSGRYWKMYIEQEIKSKNYEKVEKLFQRCLMKVLNIDLWKCYLSYVKETKGGLSSYREKMAQAYDFALDKMGMDIFSYQIWSDYVTYLKGAEAKGSYAENQRITAVRRVYQRGVVNPMVNIEIFWKDYCTYENGINPIIAKKMIDDRSRSYMNARRVAKEYESVTKGLNRNTPAVPPTGALEETKQVELWKKYINWEKTNPTRTEDQTLMTKRVMFAYEQCLLCLGHHPDVWYEAALYLENSSKSFAEKGDMNNAKVFSDEAAAIYERAIQTLMKKSMLIYFAYADFEEGRMKYEKVHNIYKRFVAIDDIDPTLVFIQYMKFTRRAEGIKAARGIFKKAREDTRTRYHVFITAALMEYYCSKDQQVAFKIFELGLKKYGDIPEYILAYVDYLSHLNEDNNTRVLFERVLTSGSLAVEKSGEIWLRFEDFEANCGDLTSIIKVEKRRLALFKEEFKDRETSLLVDRYRYLDLYPCSQAELKSIGYKDLTHKHTVQQVLFNPSSQKDSGLSSDKKEEDKSDSKVTEFPRPDLSQMLPFTPRSQAPPGSHPVPGGVFPLPMAAAHVVTRLPPPGCFQGPFVKVDSLMKLLAECTIPEPKVLDISMNGEVDDDEEGGSGKRKRTGDKNEDSDDDEETHSAPAHDIYRSRQQKRVR
ncbi:cleavage stimulation factor subunit 3-like [Asterias rubens]|uniref:cleavage stimulation factor subunit 3-like n=1 Tax=Asterias rubens TaxID=7604 RepID=UPI001455D5E2|nr:cleavage stimulation factor subunit 3-like [Asterias rubens]